jgi:hypothetical protein
MHSQIALPFQLKSTYNYLRIIHITEMISMWVSVPVDWSMLELVPINRIFCFVLVPPAPAVPRSSPNSDRLLHSVHPQIIEYISQPEDLNSKYGSFTSLGQGSTIDVSEVNRGFLLSFPFLIVWIRRRRWKLMSSFDNRCLILQG